MLIVEKGAVLRGTCAVASNAANIEIQEDIETQEDAEIEEQEDADMETQKDVEQVAD